MTCRYSGYISMITKTESIILYENEFIDENNYFHFVGLFLIVHWHKKYLLLNNNSQQWSNSPIDPHITHLCIPNQHFFDHFDGFRWYSMVLETSRPGIQVSFSSKNNMLLMLSRKIGAVLQRGLYFYFWQKQAKWRNLHTLTYGQQMQHCATQQVPQNVPWSIWKNCINARIF